MSEQNSNHEQIKEEIKVPEEEKTPKQNADEQTIVPTTIHSREIKDISASYFDMSDSGDEQVPIDEEKIKQKEDQATKIIEMLKREATMKEKQKMRREAVHALFKDDAERTDYGVKDKTVRYMIKKIREYIKELKIKDRQLKREEDYENVDDTWAIISKMMYEPFRCEFQNERLKTFETSDPAKYLEIALKHMQKKKEITIKAGEMICTFLELEYQPFIYKRPNDEPTIVEYLDPVQFMIPSPKISKVIDVMEKDLCRDLLKHFVVAASKKIKDNQEVVMIKRNQLQPLYHFLMDDMLWIEYDIDFEDFKATVMFHQVLAESNYELAQFMEDTDQELHNAMILHFVDTDSSEFSNCLSDKDDKVSIGGSSFNPKSQ